LGILTTSESNYSPVEGGRYFDHHLVTRDDFDAMSAHLSRHVAKYFPNLFLALDFDGEVVVTVDFDYGAYSLVCFTHWISWLL
jgi:hypothetical protein